MSFLIELPTYECHKRVNALKVKHSIPNPRGVELHFENERFAPIQVGADWFDRHKVEAGGYFVVYTDGYTGYSPAAAFESGYVLVEAD